MTETRILYCCCRYGKVLPEPVKQRVFEVLCASGIDFVAVSDLCGLCARRDPILREIANHSGPTKIAACHPRAVRWLFHAAGARLPENTDSVSILNMRVEQPELIIAALLDSEPSTDPGACMTNDRQEKSRFDDWMPWFPVIDYDRCVHCKQCLNFCLFGVYGLSAEERVEVQAPEKCKTNCPACARVCPEIAIMFPKYKSGPISGEQVEQSESRAAADSVDLSSLSTADILALLRRRGQADHDPSVCPSLAKLGERLEIPPEALADLGVADMGGQEVKKRPYDRRDEKE